MSLARCSLVEHHKGNHVHVEAPERWTEKYKPVLVWESGGIASHQMLWQLDGVTQRAVADVPSEAPQARSEAPCSCVWPTSCAACELCPSCGEHPSTGIHWRDCRAGKDGLAAVQCEGRRRDGARCTLAAAEHREHRCVSEETGKLVTWRGRTAKGRAEPEPSVPVSVPKLTDRAQHATWSCGAHCVRGGEGPGSCHTDRTPRPVPVVHVLLEAAHAEVTQRRKALAEAAMGGDPAELPAKAFLVEKAAAEVDMLAREMAHAEHAQVIAARPVTVEASPTARDGAADALALREELAELEERAKAAAANVRRKWGDLSFPAHHAEDIGAALSLALHNLAQLDEWVRKYGAHS